MRFFFLLFFSSLVAFSQQIDPLRTKDEQAQTRWVDSLYNSMNLDQKIGQLFMVQAFSSHTAKQQKPIKDLIKKYHIGGIIFSKGSPVAQAKLTNEFQSMAKTPLLVAMVSGDWLCALIPFMPFRGI